MKTTLAFALTVLLNVKQCFTDKDCPVSRIQSEKKANTDKTTVQSLPANGRIIGGVSAKMEDVPYQLALKVQEEKRAKHCGAVLISPTFALTAAHCLHEKQANSRFTLTAGTHKLDSDNEQRQVRSADELWIHKDYLSGNVLFDIAGLHVSKPFKLNQFVKPILLPQSNFSPEGTATVSGWGCTDRDCDSGIAKVLKSVQLPIVPQSICKEAYPYKIRDSMVCAGIIEGGSKDACTGDSGGPLVVEDGTKKVLIGLVSWGKSCGCPGYPGVYTRITSYLTWIQDVLEGKERSFWVNSQSAGVLKFHYYLWFLPICLRLFLEH